MEFTTKKGISERSIVKKLVDIAIQNPANYIAITRVFANYRKNTDITTEELKNQIVNIFNLTSNAADSDGRILSLLIEVYDSKKFSEIRTELLENIAYHFGPVTTDLKFQKRYVEPIIKDDEEIIGGSEIKSDIVFYSSDEEPIEFIECKTNISNVIPWNKPFDKMSGSHQKKITYLSNAYSYLKENFCEPEIYLACYNEDYEDEKENLQVNWGYNFINIVSPSEMVQRCFE